MEIWNVILWESGHKPGFYELPGRLSNDLSESASVLLRKSGTGKLKGMMKDMLIIGLNKMTLVYQIININPIRHKPSALMWPDTPMSIANLDGLVKSRNFAFSSL